MAQKTILRVNALPLQTVTTGTITSAAIHIASVDHVSVQYNWSAGSGTPVGTFQYQLSNDGVNYVTYAFAPVLAQTGNSGTVIGMLTAMSTGTGPDVAAEWLKVQFTHSSGTTRAVECFVFGKSKSG